MVTFEITVVKLQRGHLLVYKQNYIYNRNGIKQQCKRSHTLFRFNKMTGWSQLSQYNLQWKNYVVNFNDGKPLKTVLMSMQIAQPSPFSLSVASERVLRTQE